ncbi:MAG TPA: DUF1857 domain-containing protein [Polyangia bacterium]|jgi:hypothetical protein|nr:DUF1857 domain-containing protein [Polyangia bacterium]
MPRAAFRTPVNAPASLVWQMMKEKIERPDLYVPGVERVEYARRVGPQCFERRMYANFGAGAHPIHELITYDDLTMTVVFKLVDDARFTGIVTNTVYEADGQVELEYTMHWSPRPAARVSDGNWDEIVRHAVLHACHMAEGRASNS